MTIKTELTLDNTQYMRKMRESDSALDRMLTRQGEMLSKQTAGLRKVSSSLQETLGLVPSLLASIGVITAAAVGVGRAMDNIARSSERTAEAAIREAKARRDIASSVASMRAARAGLSGESTDFDARRRSAAAARDAVLFDERATEREGVATDVVTSRSFLDRAGTFAHRRIGIGFGLQDRGTVSEQRGFLAARAGERAEANRLFRAREAAIERDRVRALGELNTDLDAIGDRDPFSRLARDNDAKRRRLNERARAIASGPERRRLEARISNALDQEGVEGVRALRFGQSQAVGSSEAERLRAAGQFGAATKLESELALAKRIYEIRRDTTLTEKQRETIIANITRASEANAARAEREANAAERRRRASGSVLLGELTAAATGDPGGAIGRELSRVRVLERIGAAGVDDPALLERLLSAADASINRASPTASSDSAALGSFTSRGGLSARVVGRGPQSVSASAASIDGKASEIVATLREIADSTAEAAREAARANDPAVPTASGAGSSGSGDSGGAVLG